MRSNRERGREREGGRGREKGGDKGVEMERTRPATALLKSGWCTKGSTLAIHAGDRRREGKFDKKSEGRDGKRLDGQDGQDQKQGPVRGS